MRWLGIIDQVTLLDGDMIALGGLIRIIEEQCPGEACSLAAQVIGVGVPAGFAV